MKKWALVTIPHHLHSNLLIVHKASFYLWLAALLIHVIAHFKDMAVLAGRDALRRTRIRAEAWKYRQLAIAVSLLLGKGIALALAHTAETYLHLYPHK